MSGRWIYAALGISWVLTMIYEGIQGGSVAGCTVLGILGVTALAILFVRDMNRPGPQKPVPKMMHFLGAALSCALFYMALESAAKVGGPVRFLPFYMVMFCYFLGSGLFMWWQEIRGRK